MEERRYPNATSAFEYSEKEMYPERSSSKRSKRERQAARKPQRPLWLVCQSVLVGWRDDVKSVRVGGQGKNTKTRQNQSYHFYPRRTS